MKRFRGKERNGLSLCAGDNVGFSGDRAGASGDSDDGSGTGGSGDSDDGSGVRGKGAGVVLWMTGVLTFVVAKQVRRRVKRNNGGL